MYKIQVSTSVYFLTLQKKVFHTDYIIRKKNISIVKCIKLSADELKFNLNVSQLDIFPCTCNYQDAIVCFKVKKKNVF